MEAFALCVMCMHIRSGICLCLLLGMQGRGLSCGAVHLVVLCQSMLLCEVLSLPCMLFFLCVCVLVPGDVISGGCVVSDWSL